MISPCTGVCRINRRSMLCEGCHRSLAEIAEWLEYSDERKRALIEELPGRNPAAD